MITTTTHAAGIVPATKGIKRVGHGFPNFDNYLLRFLLHCGFDWDTILHPDQRPATTVSIQVGSLIFGVSGVMVGCVMGGSCAVAGLEKLSREELIALVLWLRESNVALEERVRRLER